MKKTIKTIIGILVTALLISFQIEENIKVLGKWKIIKATNEINQPCDNTVRYLNFLQGNRFEMSLYPELKMSGQYTIDKKAIHFSHIKDTQPFASQNYSFEIPIIKLRADTLTLRYNACPMTDTSDVGSAKLTLVRVK